MLPQNEDIVQNHWNCLKQLAKSKTKYNGVPETTKLSLKYWYLQRNHPKRKHNWYTITLIPCITLIDFGDHWYTITLIPCITLINFDPSGTPLL